MSIKEKKLNAFKVIGIKIRTSNALELSGKGQIGATWGKFMSEGLGSKIPNRIDNNIVAAYCEYESDMNAPYTFFLGAMVSSTAEVPSGMVTMEIPSDNYTVFNTEKGEVPMVIIDAWKKIWDMTSKSQINRTYTFDFEIYDSRASNPKSAQVDIFISARA